MLVKGELRRIIILPLQSLNTDRLKLKTIACIKPRLLKQRSRNRLAARLSTKLK